MYVCMHVAMTFLGIATPTTRSGHSSSGSADLDSYKAAQEGRVGYESGQDISGLAAAIHMNPRLKLPAFFRSSAEKVQRLTARATGRVADEISPDLAKEQYMLTVALVKQVAVNGTGILVFVSGMSDITELTEKFDGMTRFKVIAIHSEIPMEEQEAAFEPCQPNEVKVIIATNAAESSITLPDVDVVICLGTHKAIRYHPASHRG